MPLPDAVAWSNLREEEISIHHDPHDPETIELLSEAVAYLNHEWPFFDLAGTREEVIDWHRDPVSGKVSAGTFSLDINYRDERLVGNIKNTWEKNRHHHLTVLALGFHITRDERFAAEVAGQIEDWIKQNPYLIGVNWISALESGIRLLSWICCWRLLRGSRHFDCIFNQRSDFWTSVYQHQLFIERTYSRGSSANNHLIGEMSGLFCSALVWPIFPESVRWREMAQGIVEKEIVKQTYSSGINKELAFSYHIFTIEFFILALWEANRANVSFSRKYTDTLRRMIEVIPQLTDAGGNLPTYGDSDDGMAVQLRPRNSSRDKWLLEAGHMLAGAKVCIVKPFSLAANVLNCKPKKEVAFTQTSTSRGFEHAGIYVLRNNRGASEEIFLLVDTGALGYLSLAAHGHADALSFTLSVGGKPILVDPGTYCYHTQWPWRKYFRGTSGHNTLCVDNHDQSVQAGPFLWTHKAQTTIHAWQPTENGGLLEASHDGYHRVGVTHLRRINLQGDTIRIYDRVEGNGIHDIALYWHCSPQCSVVLKDYQAKLNNGRARVIMYLPDQMEPALFRGENPFGWASPTFGIKLETSTIACTAKIKLPCELETIITIKEKGAT